MIILNFLQLRRNHFAPMLSIQEFKKKAKNLLLIDIETVSSTSHISELNEHMQHLWEKKVNQLRKNEEESVEDAYRNRAAIYAEFGKIVCISFGGFFFNERDELSLKVKSIAHQEERVVLEQFVQLLQRYPQHELVLCAHNGKEFDFPYLCRRMLVLGIEIPSCLQLSGKKPWEILHQDTMEMWKFGDYKSYTSLDLLAGIFGITSSKLEMSGDQVTQVFYEEQDLQKISRYCIEDVVVLSKVYLRLQTKLTLDETNVIRVLE